MSLLQHWMVSGREKCKNSFQANILRSVYCCTEMEVETEQPSIQSRLGLFWGPSLGIATFAEVRGGSLCTISLYSAAEQFSRPVWGITFCAEVEPEPEQIFPLDIIVQKLRSMGATRARFDSFAASRGLKDVFLLKKCIDLYQKLLTVHCAISIISSCASSSRVHH